jgi:hypothetical protein
MFVSPTSACRLPRACGSDQAGPGPGIRRAGAGPPGRPPPLLVLSQPRLLRERPAQGAVLPVVAPAPLVAGLPVVAGLPLVAGLPCVVGLPLVVGLPPVPLRCTSCLEVACPGKGRREGFDEGEGQHREGRGCGARRRSRAQPRRSHARFAPPPAQVIEMIRLFIGAQGLADRPILLLGVSSGGTLALKLAAALEQEAERRAAAAEEGGAAEEGQEWMPRVSGIIVGARSTAAAAARAGFQCLEQLAIRCAAALRCAVPRCVDVAHCHAADPTALAGHGGSAYSAGCRGLCAVLNLLLGAACSCLRPQAVAPISRASRRQRCTAPRPPSARSCPPRRGVCAHRLQRRRRRGAAALPRLPPHHLCADGGRQRAPGRPPGAGVPAQGRRARRCRHGAPLLQRDRGAVSRRHRACLLPCAAVRRACSRLADGLGWRPAAVALLRALPVDPSGVLGPACVC